MAEAEQEAVEPIKQKICVLKASVHCEGCKRKVKKILTQVQGVDFVDVDAKQHKVTVTGSADADTLIRKLVKSGKKAELWPQIATVKIHRNVKEKDDKATEIQKKSDHKKPNPPSDNAAENSREGSGAAERSEESGGGGGEAAKIVNDAPVKTSSVGIEETKTEDKVKREKVCSDTGEPPQAAEKEAVEKRNGGGKKNKKKKGQSGNNPASSAAPEAVRVVENQETGVPPPTNHSPPRYHNYPPQHHYHAPPPQPVYAVSYNTVYPSSSYTASYFTAPPQYNSYAYVHRGPETEPPPSDHELNPRQPLDSFEIFSDENPNGCAVV